MMKYVVCMASRGGGAVARQSIWKSHTSALKLRGSSSSSSAAWQFVTGGWWLVVGGG